MASRRAASAAACTWNASWASRAVSACACASRAYRSNSSDGAVSSGFVRFRANRSKSNEPVDGLQARSREIELLAEFAALLDSLACRVHERAQLISKLEQQPRSSRDRRTLERLLVRLKIEIELQIEIELEIAVVEGMAHSFVCEDLLHAPCE